MSAIGLRLFVGLPRRERSADDPPAGYTARETLLLLIAAVAVTGALIHIGAAVDHFSQFPLYTLVFLLLASVQIGWAAMLVRHPSERMLQFGCAFNLAVIALWIASRTIGVPIAPRAWVPETVGVADLIETVGEGVIVIALLSLMTSARHTWAGAATRRMAPVLLFVLVISVLYGVGAHAG
jgi:uncharacterized membrane protein